MSRGRKPDRVVVVHADPQGNVLHYDVQDRLQSVATTEMSVSLPRTPSFKQSAKVHRGETYEDFEGENDDYENEENRTTQQNTSSRGKRKQRRVRYVRPKSTVKIFDEKPDWTGNVKIDAKNEEAIKKINNAPKPKMFHEKLDWRVKPRTDTHNETVLENFHQSTPKRQIFDKKPVWNADARIDSHNEKVADKLLRPPDWEIYNEKIKWTADPKIDSHNEELVEQIKNAPKPIIYHETFTWPTTPRTDNHNEEYIKQKEREKSLKREKPLHSLSQEWKPKTNQARIDHQNPQFDEHIKRQKSGKLPPIEDQKLEWKHKARISQRNDDYIERLRQKRSIPLIFREKLAWRTRTPKIDHRNEEYVESLKDRTQPKIVNTLPRWNSQSRIDAYNESYDPKAHEKPKIVSQKLQWHARPRIDTGLEPDSEEEQYDYDYDYDDDSAA